MITKLREKLTEMPSEKRRKFVRIAFLVVFVVLATMIYYSRGGKHTKPSKETASAGFREIQPQYEHLQKSLYYETRSQIKALSHRLDQLSLELKALNQKVTEKEKTKNKEVFTQIEALRKEIESLKKGGAGGTTQAATPEQTGISGARVPPPPPSFVGRHAGETGGRRGREFPEIIGDIGYTSVPEKKTMTHDESSSKTKKKEKENTVYLPPSFVEADLISGFAAPTMEAAKANPIRTFLRLRDLAILPNKVKQDLKGCFVIAEGYGNLADERAHLRLLRLSCIARDGSSVIDEKVKGFVTDEDGKIGLRGRVVTKAGALLARSFIAGFLEGFGSAYSESAYDLSTTAAGELRTLKPGEATKAGIGKGISMAARNISQFYLDMARQAFPVIEVGAGKRVTVVFDEGVLLHIKKRCLGGRDGCREKESELAVLADL